MILGTDLAAIVEAPVQVFKLIKWVKSLFSFGKPAARAITSYAHYGSELDEAMRMTEQHFPKSIVVTEASITKALEGSTMSTLQAKVSLPMVQRYVKMLESGSISPPIKVANGVIVEGNHRYVAGRIFGVEPAQVPYVISPSQMDRIVPIQKTVVDLLDWER